MKYQLDTTVKQCDRLNQAYALLRFYPTDGSPLPVGIEPGQFVQVLIPDSPSTFLRRPISVCMADYQTQELWLLVRDAGAGTHRLVEAKQGEVFNMILPLGHGFTIPTEPDGRILLVGGGVGVAPLLYLGQRLKAANAQPEFLLAAKSQGDLLLVEEFEQHGPVHLATDDGSAGERGFAHQHSVLQSDISRIACCGPTPMMRAVAHIAHERGIECEVSLENMMACGIGACLCCVEDTQRGNTCVCTEGPVFNINQLKWQI